MTLYSLNTTPPILYNSFSANSYETVGVYVPQEALTAYQNAEGWKKFKSLKGFDPTGINNIKDNAGQQYRYYDLNGNQLLQPRKGVNIVKSSDGKTKKVMMK